MSRIAIVFVAAIVTLAVQACESDQQRQARVEALLDAQLPQLEICARMYDQVDIAFSKMDAALESGDPEAFTAANAEMESSQEVFLTCLSNWQTSLLVTVQKAGLTDEKSIATVEAWTLEQWSRLELDRQPGGTE